MKYPTESEIKAKEIKFSEETINIVQKWKSVWWSGWSEIDAFTKVEALTILIQHLANARNSKVIVTAGEMYCYIPTKKAVVLDDDNPSVISSLHEVAHHFYGHSELQACRWSIQLFAKVFPKDYANLKWEGHMLKRK